MDIEEIKKLSETFQNLAQPIVSLIAAILVYKAATENKGKKK